MKTALLLSVCALAGSSPLPAAVSFLRAHELADGGFADAGSGASAPLTAWAALGLRAAGATPAGPALAYLVAHEGELHGATDVELALLGETALGGSAAGLIGRLRGYERRDGAIGTALNSTAWGMIALGQAGMTIPLASVRYLVRHQSASGGWSWTAGAAPDSNDTAAAIEALRAAGITGLPIARGLVGLRRFQGRDGGFSLARGRGSDAQSTAWAIQAFAAAGARQPRRAFAYLASLRRPDGSYRYNAVYPITPVWVTAQVLPALSARPFPLRPVR